MATVSTLMLQLSICHIECRGYNFKYVPSDTVIQEGKAASPVVKDDPELAIYDPWGKSGGGAPIKDTQGHMVPNIYGRIRQEVRYDIHITTVYMYVYVWYMGPTF